MRIFLAVCLAMLTGCARLEVTTSSGTRSIPLHPQTYITIEVFNKCAPEGTLFTPQSKVGTVIKYNERGVARFRPGIFDDNDYVVFSIVPSGGQYEYEVIQQQFMIRDFVNTKASWVIERVSTHVSTGSPVRCQSRVIQAM